MSTGTHKAATTVPPIVAAVPAGEETFTSNWSAIQTGVRMHGARMSLTNVRLPTGELSDAVDVLRQIHITQRYRYKLGLSVGLILQHRENRDRLRYFHASQNNATLFQPLPTISDTRTLEDFASFLRETVTSEEVQRLVDTDTKWRVLFPHQFKHLRTWVPENFP